MLIGITGGKGSGKDTFAGALNFYNLKMADPLKDMLRAMYQSTGFDLEGIERKLEGDLKEEPCEILSGKTPRHAMQTLGTEWRDMIDQTLWSNIFHQRARGLIRTGIPIACTDVRFHHEVNVIRELGGTMVRVHRPGLENRDVHISELEMESLEVDTTVYNVGSIEDLHLQATTYLQELN
jgi:Deoxynucleotide monophosphate kinase